MPLAVLALIAAVCTADVLPFDPGRVAQQTAAARSRPPTDTGEFLIDTTPSSYTVTSRGGPATPPAVTFGDNVYLVCWKTLAGSDTVFGARVSSAGVLLDSQAFVIAASASMWGTCAAAYGDSVFMVAWEHSGYSIRAARVNLAGRVLDPGGFTVADHSTILRAPDLAFNGSLWFVVWQDSQATSLRGWQIWGQLVTPAGSLLDTPFVVSRDTTRGHFEHGSRSPATCATGSQWLVAWESKIHGFWGIAGARVDSSGTVLDTSGLIISGEGPECSQAAIASDGDNYLVVWKDGAEALADIEGKRITPEGVRLDREPLPIANALSSQEQPAVSFNGSTYVVTWHDSRNGYPDIYGARVASTGEVLDPQGIPVCTADSGQEVPAIACAGDSGGLVVWQDRRVRQNGPVIRAVRVDSLGRPTGPELFPGGVIRIYATQNYPAVAFDGVNYLVVWEDERAGVNNHDVYGALLSGSGQLLEPGVFSITAAASQQQSPAVTFGDSVYLVVWEDLRDSRNAYDVYGARVTRDGRVLDPEGIRIMYRYNYSDRVPAVAYDGANFCVVWSTDAVSAMSGRFVDQAGQVDSAPFVIPLPGVAADPDIAFGDSLYLAVTGGYSARISRRGVWLDSALIASGGRAVTFGNGVFCSVWITAGQQSVYAGRVTQAGEVLNPGGIAIFPSTGTRRSPTIAFDGGKYVMVWQDATVGPTWDIHGASLTRLLTNDTFAIVSDQWNDDLPAVAHGPDSTLLVVYSCTTGVTPGRAPMRRIWGKFIEAPVPLIPRSPAQLYPPAGLHFQYGETIVLIADTLRPDLDSFQLAVTAGDTVWQQLGSAPVCTIPGGALGAGSYIWACRGHGRSIQWSPWSGRRLFMVDPSSGLEELTEAQTHPPELRVPSVVSRRLPVAPIRVSNAESPVHLHIFSADGRKVADAVVPSHGRIPLALRASDGRLLPVGVYVLRAQVDGCAFERKFVVVE